MYGTRPKYPRGVTEAEHQRRTRFRTGRSDQTGIGSASTAYYRKSVCFTNSRRVTRRRFTRKLWAIDTPQYIRTARKRYLRAVNE